MSYCYTFIIVRISSLFWFMFSVETPVTRKAARTHTHTHTHSHPQHKLQTTLAEFIGQEKHGVPVLIGLFARQKKSKELYNL